MRTREERLLDAKRIIAGAVRATRGTGSETTADLEPNGLLKVEQVKAAITVMQEAGEIGSLINWKMVGAKSGKIPRRQFGTELLRAAQEKVGPGSFVKPDESHVDYALEKVRLAWDTSEEVFLYGVEGEDYEAAELEGFMNSFGLDIINLAFNGDKDIDPSHEKYAFRKTLNGWLKKVTEDGGNVVDASTLTGGAVIGKHIFTAAKKALPTDWKSRFKNYVWVMNPDMFDAFVDVLSEAPSTMGDRALIEGTVDKIKGVKYVLEASFPTDQLLLVDPKQLAVVYARNMKLRTTTEGVTAASEDARYNFLIGDYDAVIYWPESAVLVTDILLEEEA